MEMLERTEPRSTDLQLGAFTLSKIGVRIDGEPAFDDWQGVVAFANRAGDGFMWWVGDLLNYGEQRYGEMYSQAIKESGYDYGTIANAKYVASNVAFSCRNENVSFKHHTAVAPLKPAEQRKWLKRAEKEDLSAAELRTAIKRVAAESSIAAAQELIKENPFTLTDSQDVIQCQALISDPPYGILDQPWEPAELEAFTREWSFRWNSCGADSIAIFWSQDHLRPGREWLDECLADYTFQQLLVWVYRNNKSPQSRKGFKQTWEPIFFYRRNGSTREILIGESAWGDDLHDMDTHVEGVPQSNFNDQNMKVHPAQKPVGVMRWLVNALTVPGELVCDPFAGSGTTGIAALQLGRRFHGIELDAEYRKLAQGRIALYGTTV